MSKQGKAHITFVDGHWQHKVCAKQLSIRDAFKPHFRNDITVFIPQLTPEWPKPCVFMHMKSGFGRAFLRCEQPLVLASYLEEMALWLRSNYVLDKWDRINEISDALIVDNLFLDEDYLDMDLFNKE